MKKPTAADEYLNGYILVGGFWAPRHCWMAVWNRTRVPKQNQNHFLAGEAKTREELAASGIWALHSVEDILAITGQG